MQSAEMRTRLNRIVFPPMFEFLSSRRTLRRNQAGEVWKEQCSPKRRRIIIWPRLTRQAKSCTVAWCSGTAPQLDGPHSH